MRTYKHPLALALSVQSWPSLSGTFTMLVNEQGREGIFALRGLRDTILPCCTSASSCSPVPKAVGQADPTHRLTGCSLHGFVHLARCILPRKPVAYALICTKKTRTTPLAAESNGWAPERNGVAAKSVVEELCTVGSVRRAGLAGPAGPVEAGWPDTCFSCCLSHLVAS